MTFVRFPRTPHLAWLGPGTPRDDKVLTPSEARELLAHDVLVEEKVDGANVGFSVDDEGTLRVQNRGSYVLPDSSHPQFKPLARWLAPRRHALVDALGPDLILFGEWCYHPRQAGAPRIRPGHRHPLVARAAAHERAGGG